MKTILHIVPCFDQANGVCRVGGVLSREQGENGYLVSILTAGEFVRSSGNLKGVSEVWIHGMWLPRVWIACCLVISAGVPLVRMTHGSLSPISLERQGKWKKKLVAPIERWLFKHTDRVVVTCEEEKEWCERWGVKGKIEVVDLKRFFNLDKSKPKSRVEQRNLHVLYLGRRHPLKGVEFLERAVTELNHHCTPTPTTYASFSLHIVSDHFGVELERDWEWCDVLCLPTLSENFGLVVAEALERGKRVITTDGAPAWAPPVAAQSKSEGVVEQWRDRLIYLEGFRDGTTEERVRLLKEALECVSRSRKS